ncbi:hypothetical protein HPB52_014723 [Rhipicephalus sanguineus]|uniref:Uncharacterized protein n=1 Tax=Rhipicephalus sanguineus TaxID=34632 RepID=A0A9D4YQ35_RHISA|nr:hypothetical protein HPB52_014723 [Rhipicephalus sanguineus]
MSKVRKTDAAPVPRRDSRRMQVLMVEDFDVAPSSVEEDAPRRREVDNGGVVVASDSDVEETARTRATSGRAGQPSPLTRYTGRWACSRSSSTSSKNALWTKFGG